MTSSFKLDGCEIPFVAGQTILQAVQAAGRDIPHLCYHPDFKPHGSCKLCSVRIDGRTAASCTTPARDGMTVASDTPEVNEERRSLLQMLFVEGNHFCPSCEKSGACRLQASAYQLQMMSPHYDHFFPIGRSMPRIRNICSTPIAAFCARCACARAAMSMARTCSRYRVAASIRG